MEQSEQERTMIEVFTTRELKDPFGIGRTKEPPFEVVLKYDHERTVAGLCDLLKKYRIEHLHSKTPCVDERPYPGLGNMDDRCDLCKRTDELRAHAGVCGSGKDAER